MNRPYTSKLSHQESEFYNELIGQLVRQRKKLNLSQADLDQMIGVSESMVAKWESKARLPGAFVLMCWAKALGMKLQAKEKSNDCQDNNEKEST
jgi:ribosome-binding protein aMBF1 (putative translation factor)